MSSRTKNYTLSEEFHVREGHADSYSIPKYSFVVPVETRWVPQFIKEEQGIPNSAYTYVYTKYGFIIVPISIVRLAE